MARMARSATVATSSAIHNAVAVWARPDPDKSGGLKGELTGRGEDEAGTQLFRFADATAFTCSYRGQTRALAMRKPLNVLLLSPLAAHDAKTHGHHVILKPQYR